MDDFSGVLRTVDDSSAVLRTVDDLSFAFAVTSVFVSCGASVLDREMEADSRCSVSGLGGTKFSAETSRTALTLDVFGRSVCLSKAFLEIVFSGPATFVLMLPSAVELKHVN